MSSRFTAQLKRFEFFPEESSGIHIYLWLSFSPVLPELAILPSVIFPRQPLPVLIHVLTPSADIPFLPRSGANIQGKGREYNL